MSASVVPCSVCGVVVPVKNRGKPPKFCVPCRETYMKGWHARWHQENRVSKRPPRLCIACGGPVGRGSNAKRCTPCDRAHTKLRDSARPRDPAKNREYCRAWYRRDPARSAVISANKTARRKARLRASESPGVSPTEWANRLALFAGMCAYCDQPATARDHVIPIARGGSDDIFNVVPACKPCNSAKRDLPPYDWAKGPTCPARER